MELATQIRTEKLSAFAIAEVLQCSRQAVRQRLKNLTRLRDDQGLVVWDLSMLPADWQRRIELAKTIKGCDTVNELLFCRQHAAAKFEYTIDQATDHEKKMWPLRKAAIVEYYRVLSFGDDKGEAEARACAEFERLALMPISTRQMRRWIEPVEECGGPQHAPDEAYVLWGKRRTLEGPPRETCEYFNQLVTENQRKFKPAYRKMTKQLKAWQETRDPKYRIPGYSEPPSNAKGSDLPLRWSYPYFIDKRRRPAPAVIAGARYGLTAIKELSAVVRRTRVGLKLMEVVTFDDQEYDFKVNVLGINSKGTRPLGLDAHDRLTDCTFASFFKPTVFDDDERTRKMLRGYDMIWFSVHVLTEIGYRGDETGTTFDLEHGTATLPQWFQDNLLTVTGGKVTCRFGGIGGQAAFGGQFDGQARGCPRLHASLESARNRLRNDMADVRVLPGATGMNRDHSPEDLVGRDRYNNLLLKVMGALPESQRPDLRFPFVEWRDFGNIATSFIDEIQRDPEHDCESWVDCGFTVQEWRLDDNAAWQSLETYKALPPDKQLAIGTYLDANPHLTRARKLSRREAFNRHAHELVKLPLWMVPQLLTHADAPDNLAVMRRVTEQGIFSFRDSQADPYGGQFEFLARVIDRNGHETRLIVGEKYKTFLNPLDPSYLLVCQPNGAYIGACQAIDVAGANDEAETKRVMAIHSKLVQEARTDLARLGRERTRELADMKMHNEGLVTPGKTERQNQIEDAETTLATELYGE